MPGLSSLCKRYFDKSDFYEILGIEKSATEKQVKKAYHLLSLKVHPDRVEDGEKEEATEKFKVLSKIHLILSDADKRSVYDATGSYDEEDGSFDDDSFDWINYWKCVFKPISKQDISDYESKYKGSEEESNDLRKAYVNGKGDMNFILESVPFTHHREEARLREIIQKFIDSGEVPAFEEFLHECPKKARRRKQKWEREAKKAERLGNIHDLEDSTGEETLKLLLESRQRERGAQMNNFFDQLAAKYGGSEKKKTPSSSRKKLKKN